ncbi:MAG: PAS domain-containing sensor histidine kinase [Ghiorsea sp.]
MKQAVNNNDHGYFFADTLGRVMHGNETLREMGQYTYAALEGSLLHHLFCDADGASQDVLPKAHTLSASYSLQTYICRKNGKPLPVELSLRHVVDDQGKACGYEGSVALEKQSAQSQKSGQSLGHILESNPSPMIHVSNDGVVMFANQASAILLSTLGGAHGKSVSRGWKNWVSQVVAMKQVMEIDVACLGIDYDCKFVPQVDGVLIYAVDVTERKVNQENLEFAKDMLAQQVKAQELTLKAEKQVRHVSEKALLEAQVSRNTNSNQHFALNKETVHDLKNMLGVVMGNASLIAAQAEGNPKLVQRTERITKAVQAAAQLCEGLMGDGKASEQAVAPISLSEIMSHADDLLAGRVQNDKVSLNFAPSLDALYINVNKQHMQRILMNLILNADESMQGSSGQILVSADLMEVTQAYIDSSEGCAGAEVGCYAYIEVEDNGGGMSDDTLAHLFEPFHSSKEQGHGLGLPSTLRLTQENGGLIHVESTLGEGSKVCVLFPLAKREASVQGKVSMLLQAAGEHRQVAEALL